MLTNNTIKALKADAKPYRKFEVGPDKGFGIQVSKGAKTFFLQYRSPVTKKRRFMNLGTYPSTSLAEARQRCREARALAEQGKDPQIERDQRAEQHAEALRAAAEREAIENSTGTVCDLFDAYIEHLRAEGKRSHINVRLLFLKDIKPKIGQLKARDVTTDQLVEAVKAVLKRGAPVRARDVRTYLMAAYSFGIASENNPASSTLKRFRLTSNPALAIASFKSANAGQRELKADEIKQLWQSLDTAPMEHATKTVIRLLLTTGGQRVEEVLGMRWDELDAKDRLWELSALRTKNDRPHVVPLSPLAIELIESMKPLSGDTLLFPSRNNPEQPMPHHSISQALRRFCAASGFPKLTPRDLRRTVKSRMGEVGISKDIRDRLQNHALHDVSSKHYDRYDYLAEKRTAINKWTAWFEETLGLREAESNILAFEAKQ